MKRFIEGDDRAQGLLFPDHLEDYIDEDNPVRVIDVFVDALDLKDLGFDRMVPEATGRPGYHPSTLLKIYIYGYLNRVQSSRRLERECQRNIELIWLTGRLAPDFKTIADFRKDYGEAIRSTCRHFVELCRRANLLDGTSVAIDGSKFKAVNGRDKNFTRGKMQRRMGEIEKSVARYLSQLESGDRREAAGGAPLPQVKVMRLTEKIDILRQEVKRLKTVETQMLEAQDKQISLTDPDARSSCRRHASSIMASEDAGGSMCEARFALLGIAKPGPISPSPTSRQGHLLPLLRGNAVIGLCRLGSSLL